MKEFSMSKRDALIGLVGAACLMACAFAATGRSTVTATGPTVRGFSPHSASVGAKVTFSGTDLGGVTRVIFVIYPGAKHYTATFTKSATSVVVTAPVAFPTKDQDGLIEFTSGKTTVVADCWGAC